MCILCHVSDCFFLRCVESLIGKVLRMLMEPRSAVTALIMILIRVFDDVAQQVLSLFVEYRFPA